MEEMKEKKHILEQLTKSHEAIKKKYNLLKYNQYSTQKVLDKTFKSITDPLQKLVTLNHKDSPVKDTNIIKQEKKLYNTNSSSESNVSDRDRSSESSDLYDTVNHSDTSVIDDFERVQKYLHNIDKNNVTELDLMTGVRKHNGKLMIGSSPISFKSDFISVGQSTFPCSSGLIELLFKKHPSKEYFSNNDLKFYKNILEISNAHRKQFKSDGDIKGTRSKKNINIILPLFQVSQGK